MGITAAAAVAVGLGVPAAAASAADAAGTPASLAPATDGAASGGSVIVVLKAQAPGLNLRTQASQRRAAARSSQAPVTSDITAHGGTGVQSLVAPDAVAALVPASEVSRLRSNPAVAEIVPDTPLPTQQGQDPTGAAVAGSAPARTAASARQGQSKTSCPFNPAGPSKPLQEPEADAD